MEPPTENNQQAWRPVSEAEFCSWVANAKARETIEYHRGYLILDRNEDTSNLAPVDRLQLTVVAARALCASSPPARSLP